MGQRAARGPPDRVPDPRTPRHCEFASSPGIIDPVLSAAAFSSGVGQAPGLLIASRWGCPPPVLGTGAGSPGPPAQVEAALPRARS